LVLVAWGSALIEASLPIFLLVGVGGVLVAIFQTHRAVQRDETLTPEDTAKILTWIRSFGPLGVAQLLLFAYLARSKFGGR
jgi:hypothetical protein